MPRIIVYVLLAVALWPASANCQQPVCGPNGCQPPAPPAQRLPFWSAGPARRFLKNFGKAVTTP